IAEDAPLDDTEETAAALPGARLPRLSSPPRPAQGALPRRLGHRVLDRPGGALVEHHGDVDAEAALHLDDVFRREAQRRAVEMAAEGDPALVHLAQGAQAEHLEAAAVGED